MFDTTMTNPPYIDYDLLNVVEEASLMTRTFRHRMGQDHQDFHLGARLVVEESEEVLMAAAAFLADETVEHVEELLKEIGDFLYVTIGLTDQFRMEGLDPEEINTLLSDDEVETVQIAGKILYDLREAEILTDDTENDIVLRVHASNMSKLGDDGQPIRREDGKVVKGPNYQAPDLRPHAEFFLDNLVTYRAKDFYRGEEAA